MSSALIARSRLLRTACAFVACISLTQAKLPNFLGYLLIKRKHDQWRINIIIMHLVRLRRLRGPLFVKRIHLLPRNYEDGLFYDTLHSFVCEAMDTLST